MHSGVVSGDASAVNIASALVDQAHELERDGRRAEARDLLEQALRTPGPTASASHASNILRWIARTYQADAMFDEATDVLEAATAAAELCGDHVALGHAFNLHAIVHWRRGDLDEARRLYLLARDQANTVGDTRLAAMTAQNLGVIASVRGELEQALIYYGSALRDYRTLDLQRDSCIALNNLGMLYTRMSMWPEAEQAYRDALAIAAKEGHHDVETQIEVNLTAVHVGREDFGRARSECDRVITLARTRGDTNAESEALKLAGIVARDTNALEDAESFFVQAADIAARRHNVLLIAEVARESALLYRRQGRNRDTLQQLNRAHRLFSQLRANKDVADIMSRTRQLEADFLEVARRWGESTESKDRYTQGHCERVADVAGRLAQRAGLDDVALFWFRIGALLHDVGKLIIPPEILNKPGRLTPEEWTLVKQHPLAGVQLLSDVEFPWDVIPIVRSHHECWDGSGYPDGLAGEDIPLTARVVCIADVYDALTTERSYKRALSHEEAMELMARDAGRQFDPSLFTLFEDVMRDDVTARAVPSQRRAVTDEASPVAAAPGPARDELTGLWLRRAFTEKATEVLQAIGESTVALLVIDVDHFKNINDTFGHLQGDDVLRGVAETLTAGSRVGDILGRYAGDEFVMLLPATSAAEAESVAERLRLAVEALRVPVRASEEGHVSVTLSIGVAMAPEHGPEFEPLFGVADRALYDSKLRGRNAVSMAGASTEGKPRLDIERFVGREMELRALLDQLESALRGESRIVSIVGEAGIGKTTMVKRLAPEVRLRTGVMVMGRSHEADVRPPYGPWADVISGIHGLGIVPPRSWEELGRLVPELLEPGAPTPAGVGNKYALLDEIAEYVRSAAARRPLVLVLDDMQWGDAASWDALEHVVAQLDDARLLICLTLREEDATQITQQRRRLSRSERYTELRLARLLPAEVSRWIADVLHQADIDADVSQFLYRYTEGNPLFVKQVMRSLFEDGAIWYGGKRWEWNSVEEFELPVAVEDLLARRLGRLSPTATKLLTLASAAGRTFDALIVREAADVSEAQMLDAIDEGLAVGVIESTSAEDPNEYTFVHGLLADALRKTSNPRRLQLAHRRLADVFAKRRPESVVTIAVLYERGGDSPNAHHFALLAGERAASVYALEDAVASFRIAVRNAQSPEERVAASLRLIAVARIGGQYAEAERTCDQVLADDRAALSLETRIGVARTRLELRALQGEPIARTLDEAQQLLAEARTVGDKRNSVSLLTIVSDAHSRLSDWREAHRLAREAHVLAETLEDLDLRAETQMRLGTTLWEQVPNEALSHFVTAQQLYEAIGNKFGQLRCMVNAGIAQARLGDTADAELSYREAADLAEASHIAEVAGLAALNLGVLRLKHGEYDAAAEQFQRALRQFTKVKSEPRRLAALYNLANLVHEQGDPAAALARYRDVAKLATELGMPDVRTGALAGVGLSALAMSDLAEADSVHEQLMGQGESNVTAWFQGRELVEAFRIRYLIAKGNAAKAIATFNRALRAAGEDQYGALWLSADAVPALAMAGCMVPYDLVAESRRAAELAGFRPLAKRLQSIASVPRAGGPNRGSVSLLTP
ncbi:MAG: diguanylate cyclase [Gemmatimonadaceae bacterium]